MFAAGATVGGANVQDLLDIMRANRCVCEECQTERASVFCVNCDAPLCNGCWEKTHSSRLFSWHRRLQMQDGKLARQEPMCPAHPTERLRFVSTTDQQFLCRDCLLLGKHSKDKCISIKEAAAQARSVITHLVDRAAERGRLIRGAEREVNTVLPMLEENYAELVGRVVQPGLR